MFAILFDLEGTLVQSIGGYRKFINETKEKLLELGIPSCELGDMSKSSVMLNKGADYVEKNFNKEELIFFQSEIDQFLKKYELYWADKSWLFPDTVPALQKLKKLKYKMGIVTNTSRLPANRILEKNKIGDFFDIMVTRNEVKRLKPDPEGILLALKKLDVNDFFFVGDLIFDSKAAETLGGVSIIVNRSSSILNFSADYIVNSLIEIPEIILQYYNR